MNHNLQCPEAIDVDFDSVLPDQDFDPDAEPVRIPTKTVPTAQHNANNQHDDLLDLSDEATLDKLSAGGFLRIRPEGQNMISVAFSKPAVLEKTHYSQERNKTIRCLQPASDF